jgi:hypothetical protein
MFCTCWFGVCGLSLLISTLWDVQALTELLSGRSHVFLVAPRYHTEKEKPHFLAPPVPGSLRRSSAGRVVAPTVCCVRSHTITFLTSSCWNTRRPHDILSYRCLSLRYMVLLRHINNYRYWLYGAGYFRWGGYVESTFQNIPCLLFLKHEIYYRAVSNSERFPSLMQCLFLSASFRTYCLHRAWYMSESHRVTSISLS